MVSSSDENQARAYDIEEMNRTATVSDSNSIIWPKGSIFVLNNPTRLAPLKLRQKRKLERQNRKKGRR